ncbi:TetR/AcrR family transcriptional regulator [Planotetraspora kaengkrachanensis]|uniref:TetR family transcriptional regulator n=1 Tax=Planotetraspora kaengkrachanensis TaxID=575193 RepID=A0A8J3PRW9_9ACTN|nr:TetR/AcrR family transcriptional regulator [Planotetraspora kaengkrachanensis]GIG77621.1 TetR family transcriptional regulator [Planotetraspora kaengkrachanensis]
MGRPRTFDIDAAVDRAMTLFWRQGFEATSTEDLVEGLGITRGSLYKAFGSKEQLYAMALRRYCQHHAAGLIEMLDRAEQVRPAIRAALLELVEADLADPVPGCLLVNAATERSAHADTVQQVSSTMGQVESALAGALERARARGEIAADKEPRELAQFLTTFLQGLRVMGKARANRAFLENAVEVAVRALD